MLPASFPLRPLLSALLCLTALCASTPAVAVETRYLGPLRMDIFGEGERIKVENGIETTSAFSRAYIAPMIAGLDFWLERVNPAQDVPETVYALAFIPEEKASAYSWTPEGSAAEVESPLFKAWVLGESTDILPDYGYHTVNVLQVDFPAELPRNLALDGIMPTFAHEMMHSLGMGASGRASDATTGKFEGALNRWTTHLYDAFGTQAKTDMPIKMLPDAKKHADQFILFDKGTDVADFEFATFHGATVDALTSGKGMPVNSGKTTKGFSLDLGTALSHPALIGSHMSYADYRNLLFSEVELAVLNDLGYAIDLRTFFGKSYYSTVGLTADAGAQPQLTVVNTDDYGSKDAPATASYGVGLHVFRDNLTVTQAADIYTTGTSAAGVRVDGAGNHVIIPGSVTVAADGLRGTALAVAYGRNNELTVKGALSATGEDGIGIEIAAAENYASYQQAQPENEDPEHNWYENHIAADMNGPMVSALSISGTVQGRRAAIEIGSGAHVETINIQHGASIKGNIISHWDNSNAAGKTSALNFDLAGGAPRNLFGDPDMIFSHDIINASIDKGGAVTALSTLLPSVKSGKLLFNGTAMVEDFTVTNNAALAGNATIKGELINEGLVSPGDGLGILQTEKYSGSGGLHLEYNAHGEQDLLTVATGSPVISGALYFSPKPDFYTGTLELAVKDFVKGATLRGNTYELKDALPYSPTLLFTQEMRNNGAVLALAVKRPANAYSRYAGNGAAAGTGRQLRLIADSGRVRGDMEQLFTALDFSTPAAVRRGLGQLSGESYRSAGLAAMDTQRNLSGMFTRHMLASGFDRPRAVTDSGLAAGDGINTWRAFGSAFGGTAAQQKIDGYSGYASTGVGLMGGLERGFESGLTAGMHLAVQHSLTDAFSQDDANVKTDTVALGVHGFFQPAHWDGAYVMGQLRGGVENNSMNRHIDFAGYQRDNTGKWAALLASAMLGGGYDLGRGDATFGPVAWLDYTSLWRPEFTENGGGASRLTHDADTLRSLRSSLGGRAALQHRLENGRTVMQMDVLAVWQHELLSSYGTSHVAFNGFEEFGSARDNDVVSRDSLLVQAGAQLKFAENSTLRVQAGSEFMRRGYQSLTGSVSLSCEF